MYAGLFEFWLVIFADLPLLGDLVLVAGSLRGLVVTGAIVRSDSEQGIATPSDHKTWQSQTKEFACDPGVVPAPISPAIMSPGIQFALCHTQNCLRGFWRACSVLA